MTVNRRRRPAAPVTATRSAAQASPNTPAKAAAFAPRLSRLALETRILFDGAGAVAGADAFADDPFFQDAQPQTQQDTDKEQPNPLFDENDNYVMANGAPEDAGAADDDGDVSVVEEPVDTGEDEDSADDDLIEDGDTQEPVGETLESGTGEDDSDAEVGEVLADGDDLLAEQQEEDEEGNDGTDISDLAPEGLSEDDQPEEKEDEPANDTEPQDKFENDTQGQGEDNLDEFGDESLEEGLMGGLMMAPMSDGDPVDVVGVTDPATRARLMSEYDPANQDYTPMTPFAGEFALVFDQDDDVKVTGFTISVSGGTFTIPGLVTDGDSYTFLAATTVGEIKAKLAALQFTPTAYLNNQGTVTPTFTVGTAGNTIDIEISVTPVNNAPIIDGAALVLKEGKDGTFSLANLAPGDNDTERANALDPDIKSGQQQIGQLMLEITSLPGSGTLTYKGGAVEVGQVIPVTDLGQLRYAHNGTDLTADYETSIGIKVHDGGGGVTEGELAIIVEPDNKQPTVSGSPHIIEGQHKELEVFIELGDDYDYANLEDITIKISDFQVNGHDKSTLWIGGQQLMAGGELTVKGNDSAVVLEDGRLKLMVEFRHDGTEPNDPGLPGDNKPSFTVTVTDAGGGVGEGARLTSREYPSFCGRGG